MVCYFWNYGTCAAVVVVVRHTANPVGPVQKLDKILSILCHHRDQSWDKSFFATPDLFFLPFSPSFCIGCFSGHFTIKVKWIYKSKSNRWGLMLLHMYHETLWVYRESWGVVKVNVMWKLTVISLKNYDTSCNIVRPKLSQYFHDTCTKFHDTSEVTWDLS